MNFRVGLRCRGFVAAFCFSGFIACSQEDAAMDREMDTEPSATPIPSVEPETISADLENGKQLFSITHCWGCHSPAVDPDTGEDRFMAGGDFAPGLYSANITQDVETGIGSWSDADIEKVLRTGIRPDGTKVHGVMPFSMLRHLTEQDMQDLIAHLRTVPPIPNAVPRSGGEDMAYPANMFENYPAPPTASEVGEEIARGAYIATLAHCMGCHTYQDENGHQDFEAMMGNGGMLFEGPVPAVSANITPHMEDGIGAYSVADIVQIFRTGKRPDGSELAPIMGTRDLQHLPQSDLEALAAYLKWLPPRPSPVPGED